MATIEESNYNKQIRALGSWIDKPFLENVLKIKEKHPVKIIDINVRAAVGAGDNYLSTLYKTTVEYCLEDEEEIKELHIMIKGETTARLAVEMNKALGVFNKETYIYIKVLPALHTELLKYFPEGTDFIAAKSYPCTRENTIIMEDLGVSGYKMANRQEQLDFAHAEETLKTLARYHALSVKVYQTNPDIIDALEPLEYFTEDNRQILGIFLEQQFPILAKVVENWGEHARYKDIIFSVSEFGWDKMMHLMRRSPNFNVLIHGDLWVNNILYRYNEEGKVMHAKLIDFQLGRYTSPAIDILYFLSSSVQPNVLMKRMFELIAIYHEALSSDLQALEIDTDYTLNMLHEDLRDRSLYTLIVMSQFLPMIIAPPSSAVDLDAFEPEGEDSHILAKSYLYEGYKNVMCKLLDHFENIGYLREIQIRYGALVEKWQKERDEQVQVIEINNAENTTDARSSAKPTHPSSLIPIEQEQKHNMLSKLWTAITRVFTNPPCM